MGNGFLDDIDRSDDPLIDELQAELGKQIEEGEIDDFTQEDIQTDVEKFINDLAQDTYERILSDDKGLERYHKSTEEFQENLHERWGKPLELLERLIIWSMECGRALNQEYGFQARQNENYLIYSPMYAHWRFRKKPTARYAPRTLQLTGHGAK